MKFQHVVIEAAAYALPPRVVTSAEIEQTLAPLYERLKLPMGRLEMISGIKERHVWEKDDLPSKISAMAGKKAMAKAGVKPEQIDALFHVSVCRDFMEPATATVVHRHLGLPDSALNFDLSNACLGMMSGIQVAAAMIEAGHIRRALLVSGENSYHLLQGTLNELLNNPGINRKTIKNHFASLTIGSAGAAILLTHSDDAPQGHRVLGGGYSCNTRHNDLCRGGDEGVATQGLQMQTNSEVLLNEGVAVAQATWKMAEKDLGWSASTPDIFCCHQVSKTHRDRLFEALGTDVERDFSIFETTGNCGSASWPMTLAMAEEQGKLSPGMKVALLGIGSGINCTMLGLEW